MRILWHSNAPWAPTGYGRQTALFAPMLAQHYDLFLSANYGLEAAPIMWRNIPVMPGLGQDHGSTTIPGHVVATFGAPRDGLVLTLYDVQPFDPDVFKRVNVACWTPVDHCPVSPAVVAFLRGSQAIPIAMSRFGQSELAEFDPLYVPHAVDTEVFKPTESDIREQMGLTDDDFLVGMVAANKGRPSRKCFQQAFEAFRIFHKKYENACLYVHTTVAPEYADGEDLLALAASLEIPEDRFKFPNQYTMIHAPITDEKMAEVFSAFDVLLNPSMGEGFGIPVLEAQACGVPVIVTDFTAMSEVCGAGWRVKGRPFWTGQASWMAVPDVGEIAEALEEAYLDSGSRYADDYVNDARRHALNYSAPKVFEEHMLPALREIEERIGARLPERVAA